jgi:hypothetical protein
MHAGRKARQRQFTAARAQQNQQPEAADNEPEKPNYSEGVFVLRLVAVSFAGAMPACMHWLSCSNIWLPSGLRKQGQSK